MASDVDRGEVSTLAGKSAESVSAAGLWFYAFYTLYPVEISVVAHNLR